MSIGEFDEAVKMYEGSIKSSLDYGNIHEAGLAYSLIGEHYIRQGQVSLANDCFKKACLYYAQWSATALVERLSLKHNLKLDSSEENDVLINQNKHSRQWD